ncbi:MAG: DUF445 family protein [Peptococcaceae bacterium]|jgi:uncharacterized membrane protein YheB (UPF0754 family)|nr:DUF445 family protein [Peptococcaceae bacterium]
MDWSIYAPYVPLIFMPLVGGFIGWVTNMIAIRLLFRPYEPISILGIPFQGVIPKRRAQMAQQIGSIVAQQLLSWEDLFTKFDKNKFYQDLTIQAAEAVEKRVLEKIPSIVPHSFAKNIAHGIGDMVIKEAPKFIADMEGNIKDKLTNEIDIAAIITEKINGFDMAYLEQLTLELAHKELRTLEILGGVLGAVIGLFQAGLILFIK